jgi:hypothetical protein
LGFFDEYQPLLFHFQQDVDMLFQFLFLLLLQRFHICYSFFELVILLHRLLQLLLQIEDLLPVCLLEHVLLKVDIDAFF